MIRFAELPTQQGPLRIAIDECGLRYVDFVAGQRPPPTSHDWEQDPRALAPYLAEFAAYFAGRLQVFSLPCAAAGTEFQQRVWQRLSAIGYGTTLSYGELASELGNPAASRAVGTAVGRNPLSIIIPCHRVVGRDGRLTGYAGGLAIKAALLQLEGVPSLPPRQRL
jgi:methylated-DNA-[protein]-cysteine S-methyltransferase